VATLLVGGLDYALDGIGRREGPQNQCSKESELQESQRVHTEDLHYAEKCKMAVSPVEKVSLW